VVEDVCRGPSAPGVDETGLSYSWEALQGAVVTAKLLSRAGFGDCYCAGTPTSSPATGPTRGDNPNPQAKRKAIASIACADRPIRGAFRHRPGGPSDIAHLDV